VLNIIHEDADLLVVNKPAGLVCHPTKNGEMSSLIGRARLYLSREGREVGEGKSKAAILPGTGEPFSLSPLLADSQRGEGRGEVASPHLINRLDRETSGVMLIAKNSATAGEIGKILESRAVQKEYLAIVHGHVAENHGIIDAPLGKDERSIVAVKDCVRPDGTPTQTEFFVERKFSVGLPRRGDRGRFGEPSLPFSLLRIILHTGRKHQIRIHLAHIGHAIVGDKLYGHDEDCYLALAQNRLTDAQREQLIFKNHALHARSLKFNWRGKDVEFSCEPEKYFVEFLPQISPINAD